jgi:hypothetical protein
MRCVTVEHMGEVMEACKVPEEKRHLEKVTCRLEDNIKKGY